MLAAFSKTFRLMLQSGRILTVGAFGNSGEKNFLPE